MLVYGSYLNLKRILSLILILLKTYLRIALIIKSSILKGFSFKNVNSSNCSVKKVVLQNKLICIIYAYQLFYTYFLYHSFLQRLSISLNKK
ncbi:hypothetical protein C8R34_105115 [Nitrosomonas sp. Nm84]|nr:hypothetical protein C8R34_105115 [Nitrosomonas sp. Nm84]